MSAPGLSVLQVSTADIGGGAEKVARDLHRAYLARGLDSHLAVGCKTGDEPGVLQIPNEESRSAWTRSLEASGNRMAGGPRPAGFRRLAARALLLAADPARYGAIARGVEDFSYPGTARILDLPPRPPDVLHLHNLHGYYFDVRELPRLSAGQPTILTMHDMWALTGHCAHSMECSRWLEGCGECPALDRYVAVRKDGSAEDFRIKRDALVRSRLGYVTPSAWLMGKVEQSGLVSSGAPSRVIPNGVDTAVFASGDRDAARAELGLPLGADVMLFAATGLFSNPFKDYETLAGALDMLASQHTRDLLFVALGDETVPSEIAGVEVRALPFTNDERTVAKYFRAADLYVHPARAENLPLAVMEAMACGTPVVASRVGGIPEIVVDGETGVLVEPGDAPALADAVARLLADGDRRREFARAGTARILERFTLERQVEAYLALYDELLSRQQ